jgi:hypothetical protein
MSLWRMTFGYTAPIQWDTTIKGRGVVGIGEAEELIHHAQLAWMPAEERRRYALTGPPPPDWFTQIRPAPWITEHVISEGRKLAGASLLHLPLGDDSLADVPPDVPPATPPLVPAERPSDVPPNVPAVPPPRSGSRPLPVLAGDGLGRPAGRHRAPAGYAGPAPAAYPADHTGRHRAGADPASHDGTGTDGLADDGDWIVGITAAARYLGYDKPDSFRRARTRHPIPGEYKMPDGRPCWTPAALRSWQSKRKIAGGRIHGGEPD